MRYYDFAKGRQMLLYIYIYIYIRSYNILDSCVQFRYKIQLKGRGGNGVLLEIYANCLMGLEIWTEKRISHKDSNVS